MSNVKLWEASHPYYATEGNYYSNDCHYTYESWKHFSDEMGASDEDMNLVYRWDWSIPDPDVYEDDDLPSEMFKIFIVQQRKARLVSCKFPVSRDDEPAIRERLTHRSKTIAAIWSPVILEGDQK